MVSSEVLPGYFARLYSFCAECIWGYLKSWVRTPSIEEVSFEFRNRTDRVVIWVLFGYERDDEEQPLLRVFFWINKTNILTAIKVGFWKRSTNSIKTQPLSKTAQLFPHARANATMSGSEVITTKMYNKTKSVKGAHEKPAPVKLTHIIVLD